MRYLVLFIWILLLATGVFAQDTTLSFIQEQSFSQTTNQYLGTNTQSQEFSFGGSPVVRTLNATVQGYAGSGSVQLCVYFNSASNDISCVPLPQYYINQQTFSFPISPITASTATFVYRGSTVNTNSQPIYLSKVSWTAGTSVAKAQNIFALRGTNFKKLGIVRDFIAPATVAVTVSSSDPRAVIWFNDLSSPSATGRTTTFNYNDEVRGCLNTDKNVDSQGNPICDYVDEQNCAVKGKDWFDGACCGDAPYATCQFYPDKNALCGTNVQGQYRWAAVADVGLIATLDGCPKLQLVSDGARFYTCGSIPAGISNVQQFTGKISISGHDYACAGDQIAECGGDSPYSPNAKRTGARQSILNVANYCTTDGKWVASLDGINKKSCESAAFIWTGSKCCGESDDPLQSYEEPYTGGDGNAGGCFRGRFIASGDPVASNTNIINYRGKFFMCDPDKPQASSTLEPYTLFDGTGITPTKNGPCGIPLQGARLTGTQSNIFCSPQGSWQFNASKAIQYVKSNPWPSNTNRPKKGCCTETQCWDGKDCKEVGDYFISEGKGYRCQ